MRVPSGETAMTPTLSSLATSSGVIGRACAVAASEAPASRVAVRAMGFAILAIMKNVVPSWWKVARIHNDQRA